MHVQVLLGRYTYSQAPLQDSGHGRADVFGYIEVFYNRSRSYSHQAGISPEVFERARA